MKNMEIQERRKTSPNVKTVSNGVFHQFVAWFRAGLGLGLMLFVALTTFSVLSHGVNWIEGSAKQGQSRDPRQGFSPVLPRTDPVTPIQVIRNTVAVQQSPDYYRMFREQARFVTGSINRISGNSGQIEPVRSIFYSIQDRATIQKGGIQLKIVKNSGHR